MSVIEKRANRKILVCAKHGCMRCSVLERFVPDDCEWLIKHVLSVDEEGKVVKKPRLWGKTTRILSVATSLVETVEVVLFVRDGNCAHLIRRELMGTGVFVTSAMDRTSTLVCKKLAGRKGAIVLSDDVHPWIVDAVNETGNRFLLGYYS